MKEKKMPDSDLRDKVKAALREQQGLSVKDLSEKLKVNRQFMAGVLAVLEEHRDVSSRKVGPARIYFLVVSQQESR